MENYNLTLNGNLLLFVLVSILLIWLSFYTYRKTIPPVPRWLKNVLIALRGIALFLVLFILFEPILRLSWNRSEPAEIAVLIDNSASMRLTDDAVQRSNTAKSIVANLVQQSNKRDNIFTLYKFANDISKFSPPALDSLQFNSDGTDISKALNQLKNETVDRNVTGVVLISDGIDNLGQNPVHVAEEFDTPIFPVAIGKNVDQNDLIISKITTNQITYANNRVPVDVTLQVIGYADRKIQIDLKKGAQIVDSKFVEIKDNTLETRVRLYFTPEETGFQKYQVETPLLENELTPINNQKSFYVNVLKSKMKILFISGGPDPDFKFLKRILENDTNSETTYWILKSQREFYSGAFPKNPESFFNYDCIVLHDFPRNASNSDVISVLKNVLSAKAMPVLFVAGSNTFYRGLIPIAEYLPYSPANQSGSAVLVMPQLTAQGASHPVTRIDEETLENQKKWQEMPPIYLSQRQAVPYGDSEVLLQTDLDQTIIRGVKKPLPLVIAKKTTAHKSLAIFGHGIWRWDFLMWGIGKNNELFQQFMSNSIRWLITKEDSKPVRIHPDEKIYRNGQKITFTGEVYYEDYRPLDGAEIKLKVFNGNKTLEISISGRGDGKYEGSLPALEGGEYRYEGTATYKGRNLGTDTGQFSVEDFNLEYLQTRMNQPLLKQIAARSGGTYLTENDVAALDTLLNFSPRIITETREWELWNKLTLLIIVIILLSVEWFIRKRSGML